jgi:DNA-directed RNA polymerase specialized sigma24 family protein
VSDTFLSVWEDRKQLPGIANFDAYIYSIARNKAISYHRAHHVETIEAHLATAVKKLRETLLTDTD